MCGNSISPYINRFLQPDTIIPNPANPQNWNCFGYVLNNPIRFNDPSGHICSDPENTNANAGCESGGNFITKKDAQLHTLKYRIKKSGRSDFEIEALNNLLKAGAEGLNVVQYVVDNKVKIDFRWHLYAGAAWDDEDNALYLNSDPDTTRPNDPFVLNLIAHEVTHLEGGSDWALSKIGELEAWKIGFTVQNYFRPLSKGTPAYDIVHNLDIWDTDSFTELVHEYNNTASGGWLYNIFFDLLPAWPLGVRMSPGR